jgi:hypothetical protein
MKLKNQNFIKPFYEATKKYIVFHYIKFTSQKLYNGLIIKHKFGPYNGLIIKHLFGPYTGSFRALQS